MTDSAPILKSYNVTITLADKQHPALWWEPIDKIMVAAGCKKSLDTEPATFGPMHVTYSGVSYAEETDLVAELRKKLTDAGIGEFTILAKKTGGTGTPGL